MTSLSETDHHELSNNNSGTGINDSDILEKNISPAHEINVPETSEQLPENGKNTTGQLKENHLLTTSSCNEQSDKQEDIHKTQAIQCDKHEDIHKTQATQNKDASSGGTFTSDPNQYNRTGNQIISILPFSCEQMNILNKENSVYTSADSSTATHKSTAELHTDVQYCRINSSLKNRLQQTVDNNLSTEGISTQGIFHDSPAPFCNEDESHTKNDFQPIILDVRGSYCENETEDASEIGSFHSSGTAESKISTISTGKTTGVNKQVEPTPKSAFHLLQHVVSVSNNHLQPDTSSKDINGETANADFEAGDNISNSLLPLIEKSSKTNDTSKSRKNYKFLLDKLHSDSCSQNSVSVVRTKQPVTQSSLLSMPYQLQLPANSKAPPANVILCPVTTESQTKGPSQLHSKVLFPINTGTTAYSCVFVQDNTQNKHTQNKVALLIPRSLPGFGGMTSAAPSVVSQLPLAAPQTSTQTSQTHVTPSCSVPPANNNTPIRENISKLVTDTMNSFIVQGKDLRGSSLLKISTSERKEYPEDMLKCAVCGEGYHHEEGLNFHLKRTAFHLSFHCPHCQQMLVFYNKCSLWMHLMSETNTPMINLSDILWLKPYEFHENDNSDISMLDTTDNVCASDASATVVGDSRDHNLLASLAQAKEVNGTTSNDQSTVTVEEPSSSDDQSVNLSKCPTCLQNFPKLIDHLCPDEPRKLMCPSCGMFLPSICARVAHIEIHKGVTKNMSCPECGEKEFKTTNWEENMRPAFDHFDSCYHFNRVLHITCFCNKEFTHGNMLLQHFANKHNRTLFKCHFCVLAFTKYDLLVAHVVKKHKNKYTHIKASVLCLYCQQISNTPDELREHIDKHIKTFKQNSFFMWKCFICPKLFADKAALKTHLGLDHPHKTKRCTICYSLFWSRKNLVEHIVEKKCLRLQAKNLNYCVDMPENSENLEETENFDLSKLFEIKPAASSVIAKPAGHGSSSQRDNNQLLVNDPQEPSDQSQKSNQSDQQHNSLEKSNPAQQVQQIHPAVSSASNSSTVNAAPQRCKIIITNKSNSGNSKSTSVNVIQCNVCKMFIESSEISKHLKFHQSQGVIICFLCQRKDFKTVKEAMEHSAMCAQKIPEDTEILVRSESSADIESGPQDIELNDSQIPTEGKNDEIQTLHSVFPCLLCGLAFESLLAREEHVSRSHDGTRIVYHCGLCRKRGKATGFTRRELATRHITKKHRIVNMDTVNRLIRTEEQNVSSGEKLPTSELKEDRAEGEPAPKRLRVAAEGDYMCGKCGFSCSGSEEFSQHITSHNPSQEPQCPECGLCFTVLPALKKHLLAVHKIKAVDDYLKEKNLTEPETEEEDMEPLPEIHPFSKPQLRTHDFNNDKLNASVQSSPSNPLECTVCYKVFEVEASLKTHMRNHGMAFIRSKRHKL